MATLLSGEQYGLSSIDNSRQNKSFIFVKLTDSAYRTIEEYIRNKNKISQHPTIQFLKNEGHLSFPSPEPDLGHTFNFSLSGVADIEGPKGSFECIRQSGASTLDALGTLQCKMRIHAKEDVYEAARKNWAAAEQLDKKKCTKEIKLKSSGLDIGRKVKVKKALSGGGSIGLSPMPRRDASPPGGQRASGYTKLPSGIPSIHVVSSSNSPGLNRPKAYSRTDISKCPIRERLIHLLALRPFKKPELMTRIKSEGGWKERDNLSAILKQVAYLRDNTYHLNHSLWNDVQEDWPFYSEQDRQVLKRRKPQNLTPPGSDGSNSSGSGQSPTSTHPGSPPSVITPSDLSAKRPGYFDGADGLPTKRQRISHYRRPPDTGLNRAPSPVLLPSQRSPPVKEEERRRPAVMDQLDRPPRSSSNNRNTNVTSSCQRVTSTTCSPDSQMESLEDRKPVAVVRGTSYLMEYTTIRTPEQRNRYKAQFNALYGEYRDLHSNIERVSRRFAELQERLRREENGSVGWMNVKDRILREYEENKRNPRYQEAKRRFQYLHDMLSHVKRLVHEYDSSVANATKSSPLTASHNAAY